jgi:GDPmannose 4,6-dehydratase
MVRMVKKVMITGVTGQDGSNMVAYLLRNTDVEIFGTVRRLSVSNHVNIEPYIDNPRFHLVNMDMTDDCSINNVITQIRPDFCVNFAAQSFVGESWNSPKVTFDINAMGVLRLLEAIRRYAPACRFYSAGTSEELGDVLYTPQDLAHPLRPRSPYGASKCAARHLVKVYRESYGMYAIHCVLFNHEGTRRGHEFVTRKITLNIAKIRRQFDAGKTPEPFELGNIFVKRDWSDSEDFVEAVWLMLNRDKPKEYILASGQTHTVKEFIDLACQFAGLDDVRWDINEEHPEETKLYYKNYLIMRVSRNFYRPAEVDILCGDASETFQELGWTPRTTFEQLVEKMVKHDLGMV